MHTYTAQLIFNKSANRIQQMFFVTDGVGTLRQLSTHKKETLCQPHKLLKKQNKIKLKMDHVF